MLPFILQKEPDTSLPAPVQTALQNISQNFADSVLAASGGSQDGTVTPDGSGIASSDGAVPGQQTQSPEKALTPETSILPDAALRAARDNADQQYRALFGDAAFNQAGLERSLSNPNTQKGSTTP